MTTLSPEADRTDVGNYFIANYPPFSFWQPEQVPQIEAALNQPADPRIPLGLYIHIPFCRKRCKFCYFRVYTDKNGRDVATYLSALITEARLYSRLPAVRGRKPVFVYFGGGTPSFLSAKQLETLVTGITEHLSWDQAEEVAFECEPGTLQKHKLQAVRDFGVTRLSLGVENFSDEILQENGRAHLSAEIFRAYDWARQIGFPQVNIDLIAGMVGETDRNWGQCIEQTIELAPDSVTIYQMELPYNTTYSHQVLKDGRPVPVADWPTKRHWVDRAFHRLAEAGYHPSSAYTMVKDPLEARFVYRDALWRGADMLATGVASFGHLSGVHYQNRDAWGPYTEALAQGRLPLARALRTTAEQRLVRELILQLKLGRIEADYFAHKFGVDITEVFGRQFDRLQEEGLLKPADGTIVLTRAGLLRVDSLLPRFFDPKYRDSRYT